MTVVGDTHGQLQDACKLCAGVAGLLLSAGDRLACLAWLAPLGQAPS